MSSLLERPVDRIARHVAMITMGNRVGFIPKDGHVLGSVASPRNYRFQNRAYLCG
jgi:hypothetical protein